MSPGEAEQLRELLKDLIREHRRRGLPGGSHPENEHVGAPVGDVIDDALERLGLGYLDRVLASLHSMHEAGEIYQPEPRTVRVVDKDGGQA